MPVHDDADSGLVLVGGFDHDEPLAVRDIRHDSARRQSTDRDSCRFERNRRNPPPLGGGVAEPVQTESLGAVLASLLHYSRLFRKSVSKRADFEGARFKRVKARPERNTFGVPVGWELRSRLFHFHRPGGTQLFLPILSEFDCRVF